MPAFLEVGRLGARFSRHLLDRLQAPRALHNVNDRHPELVETYTELLLEQWEAHGALSTQVTAGDEQAMTPEQLRMLRALGYIQQPCEGGVESSGWSA